MERDGAPDELVFVARLVEIGPLRFDKPIAESGQGRPAPEATRMFLEAGQAPGVVRDQLAANRPILQSLAAALSEIVLPSPPAHPVLEPVIFVQSFYRMVNQLALARGRDPDHPPYLGKVTETV